MDVLGLPLVLGLVVTGRVAAGDDAERRDVLRQAQGFADGVHAVRIGMRGGPDGAEAEGFGGEEQVLRRGGAVLRPVAVLHLHGFRVGLAERLAHQRGFTADDKDDGGLGDHPAARAGEGVLHGLVAHDDEAPGLDVQARRGGHRGAEHRLHLFVGDGLVGIGTDALAGEDDVEGGGAGGLLLLRRAGGGRYQQGRQDEKLCKFHTLSNLTRQR